VRRILRHSRMFSHSPPVIDDDDNNTPVLPIRAVGALFRSYSPSLRSRDILVKGRNGTSSMKGVINEHHIPC
jgi:hypothetical protein